MINLKPSRKYNYKNGGIMLNKYLRIVLVNWVVWFTVFPYSVTASAALKGVWHLQDRKNASHLLESAIDNAVEGMGFFVRKKGRAVLEEETEICHTWVLASTRRDFVWQCDSDVAERLSFKAKNLKTTNADNEVVTSTYVAGEKSVSITMESKWGKSIYSWSLIRDNYIEHTTVIERKGIPKPIKWTLIYSRIMR